MVNSVGMDPYFLYAYNSPNANYAAYANQYGFGTSGTNTTTTGAATGTSNPAFKGSDATALTTPAVQEEESSNAVAWLLGGIATVGAGAWFLASRGKAAGATGVWNQIKAGIKSFGKSAEQVASSGAAKSQVGDGVLTVRKVDGNQVVSIPGKTRQVNISKADELGVNVNKNLQWTDNGAKLDSAWVTFKNGNQDVRALYVDGKFTKVTTLDGGILTRTPELETQLSEIAKNISNKNVSKDVTLSRIRYSTNVDNSVVRYKQDFEDITRNGTNYSLNGVSSINTNRYLTDETAYKALDETIRANVSRLGNIPAVGHEGWKAGSATYSNAALGDKTQVIIKNGKVDGVKVDDKFYGLTTDEYKALYNEHKNIFDDIFKHQDKFEDVAWIGA